MLTQRRKKTAETVAAEPVQPRKRATAAKKPAAATKSSKIKTELSLQVYTQDDISKLAYQLWEARGCTGGSPEDDWFSAETMLRTQGAVN